MTSVTLPVFGNGTVSNLFVLLSFSFMCALVDLWGPTILFSSVNIMLALVSGGLTIERIYSVVSGAEYQMYCNVKTMSFSFHYLASREPIEPCNMKRIRCSVTIQYLTCTVSILLSFCAHSHTCAGLVWSVLSLSTDAFSKIAMLEL